MSAKYLVISHWKGDELQDLKMVFSISNCILSWDERSSIRQSISIIRFPWSPNKRILDYYCRCISKALLTRVSGHQLHRFRDKKMLPPGEQGTKPLLFLPPSPISSKDVHLPPTAFCRARAAYKASSPADGQPFNL